MSEQQPAPSPVKFRYGSWNVRDLSGKNEEYKRNLLCQQLGLYGFHLVCLQETKLITSPADHLVKDWGETQGSFYNFANSSADPVENKQGVGKAGVGFAWRKDLVRCREFRGESSRLCWGLFEPLKPGGSKSFIAVSCYAPTEGKREAALKFYQDLDTLLEKLKRKFKKQHLYIAGDFNTSFGDGALYLGKPMVEFRGAHVNAKTSWNARKFLLFLHRNQLRAANIEKKCRKKKDETRPPDDTWSHPRTKQTSLKDLLVVSTACYKQVKLCKPFGSWEWRMLSDHRPIMWELDQKNSNFQKRKADESLQIPQNNARNYPQARPSKKSRTDTAQNDP